MDTKNTTPNTALIVDDELSNRVILRSLLKRFGYSVLEAASGQSGVDMFQLHVPDIVFMDILMPEMDGYEATSKIKTLAGNKFIPIIFLTALTDEQALARCIEAGGDDFLTKPFNHTILKSKLRALERIRTLHGEVDRLYQRMRVEEEIAQKVFNTAVVGHNVVMNLISHRLQSTAIFNGDLLLTAWSPSGDLHLLLGDFTGHGLSAALGALPIAAVFRAMTAKGFPPDRILVVMNEELHELLPPGMFLAAIFIHISRSLDNIQVFNSGIPNGLVLDQNNVIQARLIAQLVPLGILPWQDMVAAKQQVAIQPNWKILLITDGVTEATAPNGAMFGQEGVEAAIAANANNLSIFEVVNQTLDEFCGHIPLVDDLSVVEIPCTPDLFAPQECRTVIELPVISKISVSSTRWQTNLSLCGGERLIKIDPIPILISQIQELEDTYCDSNAVFHLITDLYEHAITNCLNSIYPQLESTHIALQRMKLISMLPNTVEIKIHLTCEQVGEKKRLQCCIKSSHNESLEGHIWL